MGKLRRIFSRLFHSGSETHVLIYDDEDDEFPSSYVVRNKKELDCLRRSLEVDEVKNIRHHRLFVGVVKWVFYLLVFYIFSDVLLELLYRFHMLVHVHAPWDIPKLIHQYFFDGKRGFPGHI
ncbi:MULTISPECIES: hypothetical protein [Sporomusa]|uniref:hypothetical protein n=1 Tax=Sporomusa TaxID=2375 RepID=UPI001664270C|nr:MULTISPECIES: hypothetical protein [Sporomusa]HML35643.1 hypothetical protein [Sporomusa sphaeroides]